MQASFWRELMASGLPVPEGRPLDAMTEELTRMLGSPDPEIRDDLAFPVLGTWIQRGVYDHLLSGLGDGMVAGLSAGIGETGTDSVFRRAASARVLTEVVARDETVGGMPPSTVLSWADAVTTWVLREKDHRGHVPGRGQADALVHGADAIGRFARSVCFQAPELTVLLDVLADRLLIPAETLWPEHCHDHLAEATLQVLRRDLVPLTVLEPWVNRIAANAHRPTPGVESGSDPDLVAGNPQRFLRSLHLRLALAGDPPALRADLLLTLIDAVRATNPSLLGPTPATEG